MIPQELTSGMNEKVLSNLVCWLEEKEQYLVAQKAKPAANEDEVVKDEAEKRRFLSLMLDKKSF
jgi:hypothetical protein